jgi:hypothetical protein
LLEGKLNIRSDINFENTAQIKELFPLLPVEGKEKLGIFDEICF